MTATILRIEPFTMAVIFSMDLDPGFYVKPCSERSLFDTVHAGLFMCEPTAETRAETADAIEQLKESGTVTFEDGWIALRVGIADVVSFLTDKVGESKREERFADECAAGERQSRDEWQKKYETLAGALAAALGPHMPAALLGDSLQSHSNRK